MFIGRGILLLVLTVSSIQKGAEKEFQVIESLAPRMKIFNNPAARHLSINLTQKPGSYLRINSDENFYLFINSVFVAHGHSLMLRADSLKEKYPNVVFLSVYQKKNIDDLEIQWVSSAAHNGFYNPKRPVDSFSNFILIASILLIIFFTSLLRTNPQLTLDYLDVIKLFSFRESEDGLIALRITSSVNLLFYFFASMTISFVLITASHFTKDNFSISSGIGTINSISWKWLVLSAGIFALLLLKLGLAAALAKLFDWKDIAGYQFFYFVRMLVLSLALFAIVSVAGFAFGMQVNFIKLIEAGCVMLLLGAVLLYFKLLARAPFRSFHLFSYLCVSEIFPLVILIKVLLF